ncbi:MAG: glycosyltransferase [Candidatus Promineifilaceae bacterium]
MRVSVLANGSRGDIQPYLALSIALKAAGYDVLFAANANFEGLVGRYNIPFHPLPLDSLAFVKDPKARAWLESTNPVKLAWGTVRAVRPNLEPILRAAWEATENADAIIYHSFTLPTGYYIGRLRRVPFLTASMYPMPTHAHPALPLDLPFPLGRSFNMVSHKVLDRFGWLVYRSAAKALWGDKTTIPWASPYQRLLLEKAPIVCCYSSTVLPLPDDLPNHVHVTGYWFLPPSPGWQPSPELAAFLESGPPPVYVGFGSMGNPETAEATTTLVLDALAQSGQRGLLASGWSGLGKNVHLSEHVFSLESAPHTWLLPKMSAVVHHGGVGTTGAGMRSGVPNIVIPHFADQFFWGKQVVALGAGPKPIPRQKLTAEKLAQAINRAVTDTTMRRRAAEIGQKIQNEKGLDHALEIFDHLISEAK